jgi:hypothetical protein
MMEIILNIAWAICSLGLMLLWVRGSRSNPVSRRTQILALAMVVLLLLPVISLSDDLMAMQGPAETDTSCLRRALHSGELHPSLLAACWAIPTPIFTELSLSGFSPDALDGYRWSTQPNSLPRSLDSRPPPRA